MVNVLMIHQLKFPRLLNDLDLDFASDFVTSHFCFLLNYNIFFLVTSRKKKKLNKNNCIFIYILKINEWLAIRITRLRVYDSSTLIILLIILRLLNKLRKIINLIKLCIIQNIIFISLRGHVSFPSILFFFFFAACFG